MKWTKRITAGAPIAWDIISRGNFKGGKFSTYFGAAIRNRLIRIWRDYNLKNLVCIGESEDCRGNITRILVESDYAKEYRIKKAEQNKRWYEKKKASQPPKEKKPPMTKEERSRKVTPTRRNTTPPILISWQRDARKTGLRRRLAGKGRRPRGWRHWQHRHENAKSGGAAVSAAFSLCVDYDSPSERIGKQVD